MQKLSKLRKTNCSTTQQCRFPWKTTGEQLSEMGLWIFFFLSSFWVYFFHDCFFCVACQSLSISGPQT